MSGRTVAYDDEARGYVVVSKGGDNVTTPFDTEGEAQEWLDDNPGNQHDAACPECGEPDQLVVQALVWVKLVQDGTDADLAHDHSQEWDGASRAHCKGCGWNGTFGECEAVTETVRAAPPLLAALMAVLECAGDRTDGAA